MSHHVHLKPDLDGAEETLLNGEAGSPLVAESEPEESEFELEQMEEVDLDVDIHYTRHHTRC